MERTASARPHATARWVCTLALTLACATVAEAQEAVSYRGFALGTNVQTVTELANLTAASIRTLYRRPQSLQSLEWRLPYVMGRTAPPATDPVRQITFSFYDDQLYRIVIDYDQERTEGLTARDVIQALTLTYGVPAEPRAGVDAPSATDPIAQWVTQAAVLALYQSPGVSGLATAAAFRLTLTSPRLEALAAAAMADAVRLEASDVPQREAARLEQEAEDAEKSAERSRAVNQPNFRP
jgi:hypothetical protein